MKKLLLVITCFIIGLLLRAQTGLSCTDFFTIPGQGIYTTPPIPNTTPNGFWYKFTVDTPGTYYISTCGLVSCDTKIYVYDHCMGLVWNDDMIGTLAYNDDDCGLQSGLMVGFFEDSVYYIRIGDYNVDCAGETIGWKIEHVGTIAGCTDPTSCNYNPLATVNDGSCLYYPDSLCGGPDLEMVQSELQSSLYFSDLTAAAGDCRIEEGCLNGYGLRDILNFSTHIKNIGDADYYIGVPSPTNPQFSNDNCHGHWHYEGYAYYALYDQAGNEIPIGFKNGFCVLDLECSGGGTSTYSCGNMGISEGCGDIYGAGLDCQWVDMTDIDTGYYQLVVKVNWDHDPDAIGRYETDYDNNVAHVCIHFTRDAMGVPDFSLMSPCPVIYDCMGDPFGSAVIDCEGNCDGHAVRGDQDNDSTLTQTDAVMYTDALIQNDLDEVICNDMDADGSYTVFDVALANRCALEGPSPSNDPCDFPTGISNVLDTVTLSIQNVDFINHYLDISIKNPYNEVVAYQFEMSGITIQTVANLVSPLEYNITPAYASGGTEVIGISYQDMHIALNPGADQLCRVFWSSVTDSVICISQIVDIVNGNYEASNGVIKNSCVAVPAVAIEENGNTIALSIYPNPATDIVNVLVGLMQPENVEMTITDALGRTVYSQLYKEVLNQQIPLDLSGLGSGIYNMTLQTNTGKITRRIVLQ